MCSTHHSTQGIPTPGMVVIFFQKVINWNKIFIYSDIMYKQMEICKTTLLSILCSEVSQSIYPSLQKQGRRWAVSCLQSVLPHGKATVLQLTSAAAWHTRCLCDRTQYINFKLCYWRRHTATSFKWGKTFLGLYWRSPTSNNGTCTSTSLSAGSHLRNLLLMVLVMGRKSRLRSYDRK